MNRNMLLNWMGRPSLYLPTCMAIWGVFSILTGNVNGTYVFNASSADDKNDMSHEEGHFDSCPVKESDNAVDSDLHIKDISAERCYHFLQSQSKGRTDIIMLR